MNLRRVGAEAEDRAAEYLLEKGYSIVTRRYSTRNGEIDIIAIDDQEMVFVEVKARRSRDYSPEESVGEKKRLAMRAAANAYLLAFESLDRPHRFDLIAMDADGIRHYERAF